MSTNFFKWLGPALSVVSIGLEVKNLYDLSKLNLKE